MQAKILTSLMIERVALCGRFFPLGDTMDKQSRFWPVFIEIRDSVQAVLAPPLSIASCFAGGGPKLRAVCAKAVAAGKCSVQNHLAFFLRACLKTQKCINKIGYLSVQCKYIRAVPCGCDTPLT
jgi:hypothetical protein